MKFKVLTILFPISIFCSFLSFSQLYAQNDTNSNNSKKLLVDSQPQGAYIEIVGNYSFIGRTPFVIPYSLFGKYKIKARKAGYEGFRGDVKLAKRGANRITIYLKKRTSFKSMLRSTVIPGWGQFYGQNALKGVLLSSGQLSLGLVTLIAVNNYNDEKREFEQAYDRFKKVEMNFVEAEIAHLMAKKEQKEARDAQDFKNAMIYTTIGFWIYNIFDSILFFSSGNSPKNKFGRAGQALSADFSDNKIMFHMKLGL